MANLRSIHKVKVQKYSILLTLYYGVAFHEDQFTCTQSEISDKVKKAVCIKKKILTIFTESYRPWKLDNICGSMQMCLPLILLD